MPLPVLFLLFLLFLLLPASASATVALLLPSDDLIGPADNPAITVQLSSYDPLQRRFDAPARLQRLEVQHLGEASNLLAAVKPAEGGGKAALVMHNLKRPGDYTFSVEFAPLWDATEEQFTVQSAKLCVNSLSLEEGWDDPAGLEAEIVPTARPYGLATGSLFSGQVLLNGEPAPYVLIEIVALGPAPGSQPAAPVPAPAYLVQKVRADADGTFHAAMPRPGWWGFTATVDAERTLHHQTGEMPVSLVASFWVLVRDL